MKAELIEPFPTLREAADNAPRSGLWEALTNAARSPMEEGEMDPVAALDYWAAWAVAQQKAHYDVVMVITGKEGVGKSTLGLRFYQRCSQLLGVTHPPIDLCYSANDLVRNYQDRMEQKKRGFPVLPIDFDEGVRGLLSTETFVREQRSLIKALALVREVGAILILCVPDIWLLAKQVRARRAALWLHVVKRGLARVHERDDRVRYRPDDTLGLTVSPRAPHVAFSAYPVNSKLWRDYVTYKNTRLEEFLAEIRAETGGAELSPAAKEARARAKNALRQQRFQARRRAQAQGSAPSPSRPSGV